jgi:hypothetical protein
MALALKQHRTRPKPRLFLFPDAGLHALQWAFVANVRKIPLFDPTKPTTHLFAGDKQDTRHNDPRHHQPPPTKAK